MVRPGENVYLSEHYVASHQFCEQSCVDGVDVDLIVEKQLPELSD